MLRTLIPLQTHIIRLQLIQPSTLTHFRLIWKSRAQRKGLQPANECEAQTEKTH